MSPDNFQWWDLIRTAALLPYIIIGPSLVKLYRRGGLPRYCSLPLLISFLATMVTVPCYMLFDAPEWIGWAWMGVCVASGFTSLASLAISCYRNRNWMFGPTAAGSRRARTVSPPGPEASASEPDARPTHLGEPLTCDPF